MIYYYLSHFVQILLLPPGLNLLLVVFGWILSFSWHRLSKWVFGFAFLSLWLLSSPFVGQKLIFGLNHKYPVLDVKTITKQSSAIIVLGGGKRNAPEYKNKYVSSRASLERLRYAVYLHQQTLLPIIVSGGGIYDIPDSEAKLMQNDLREYFNTPIGWLEDQSINTKDEAHLLISLLQSHGIKVAYIVTDSWHIPRAMYIFNSYCVNSGIRVVAAPTMNGDLNSKLNLMSFLPSMEGLSLSVIALHEYLGILSYYLVK